MTDVPSSVDTPVTADRRPRLRRMRLSNWQIILVALLVVGGRLVLDFSQRIVEGQQMIAEQRALESEITKLLLEQKALEAERSYYSSPMFIETWTHTEGKMVQEGERLVVPVYERATPPPTELAAAQQQAGQPAPDWLIWWTLFFDEPPPFVPGG